MSGHTPGPWRWEVSLASKSVKLCGGSPKSGYGKYDLTVMDFRRWGLNAAQPEFWNWDLAKSIGEPLKASDIAEVVEGREHHANWFRTINHPDARLIAAAPDLLGAHLAWNAAEDARNDCSECGNEGPWEQCGPCSLRFGDAIDFRSAAIAKATGQ